MKKLGKIWLLLAVIFSFSAPVTVLGQTSTATAQFQVLPSPTDHEQLPDASANPPQASNSSKLPGTPSTLPQTGSSQLQIVGWLVLVVISELGLLWHQERRRQHED
ncbi:hypothetical protein [Lacticaseibacillus porcinae]|uniref:hypothetical protein n=1 Tax=Lacticaseibacillus porcinae TaxID=1123687 RepID=UPI000F789475|nr:hypothetical protein [Lacticaseibacillus porcinae]